MSEASTIPLLDIQHLSVDFVTRKGTVRAALLAKNGQVGIDTGAIGNTMTSPSSNTSGLGFQIAVAGLIRFTAGDTLQLRGRQDTGANQSPNAWLEAFLVRPT